MKSEGRIKFNKIMSNFEKQFCIKYFDFDDEPTYLVCVYDFVMK